ncbi:hypothetical protein CH252_18980 [Rhodococcus sp. 06-1477-1B]|nr:hypothetical protein CH252_18980 [Rhodococcus sp. 06-1477-1B]
MSSADLWEDDYPHGTVEGYDGGCRGGACPAQSIDMPCKRAKTLAAGDIRYNRLVAAGKTPAEIAAVIDEHDAQTPTPTKKKTKAPVPAPPRKKAPAPVFAPDLVDDLPEHGWPETPTQASTSEPVIPATASEGTVVEPDTEVLAADPIDSETVIPAPAEDTTAVESDAPAPTEDTTPVEADTPTLADDTTTPAEDTTTNPKDEETTVATAPITSEKFTAGLSPTARTFVLRSIREWARANGFPGVPSHGRIPRDALAAFDQAHPNGIIPAAAHTEKPAAAGIEAHIARHREVREWARANGWPELTDRGLIEPEIHEAYDAAHEAVADPVAAPLEDAEQPFSADLDEVRERADMPPLHVIVRSGDLTVPEELVAPRPAWSDVTVSEDVEHARSIAALLEEQNASLIDQVRASQQVTDNALHLVSDFRARDQVHRANLATAERKAHVEKTLRGVTEGNNRLLRARVEELEAELAEATKPWWKRIF